MRIITCNIRCSIAADGPNNWSCRRELCGDTIRAHMPDIVCFQEMCAAQFSYLTAALPDFGTFGMADRPGNRDPVNTILYRRSRFRVVSASGYWLSETPHISGSRSWNSAAIRLANWLRLDDLETGLEFRVINTHLDHVSRIARERQARLILDDAAAYPEEYPQLLAGDLNCPLNTTVIDGFFAAGWKDTYEEMYGPGDPGPTFHGFLGAAFKADFGRIDWIMTKGAVRTRAASVIRDSDNGRFPSDHYFVCSDVEILPG